MQDFSHTSAGLIMQQIIPRGILRSPKLSEMKGSEHLLRFQ